MVIEKIFVNSVTQLSLSDRFTILQNVRPELVGSKHAPRHRMYPYLQHRDHIAMLQRNNSLIHRFGGTPVAQAAMALKKIPLKQRIGKIGKLSPHSRPALRSLNLSPRLLEARIGPGRWGLSRASSFTNLRQPFSQNFLSRTNSVGDLSRANSYGDLSDSGWSSNLYQRNRRGRSSFNNYRGNNSYRGNWNNRGRNRGTPGRGGGGAGREGGGGRGHGNRGHWRGKRGGWNRNSTKDAPPSKQTLDNELDEYMAGSHRHLDRELDTYMTHAMDIGY